MKKVILLFATLSLSLSSFAATYIIKDGKLQNGVKWASKDWKDASTEVDAAKLTETDNGYLTITRDGGQYTGCRLELDPSVFNLHLKGLNIVFEYELPHSAMLYDESLAENAGKSTELKEKPIFHIVCGSEVGSDFKFKLGPSVKSHICQHRVDGKFNPKAEKEFVKYESYSFPMSDEKVNTVFIAYMRELPDSLNAYIEPAKIKNLYFYAPEDFQTFYGISFDYPVNWNKFETVIFSNPATEDPTDFVVDKWQLTYFPDGKLPVYGYEDGYSAPADESFAVRHMILFENQVDNWTGSDGSGYMFTEHFHGMLVENHDWDDMAPAYPEGLYLAFEDIMLPEKYEGNQLRVSCLAKAAEFYNYPLKEKHADLPIYYKFDNQTEMTKLFGDSLLRMIYTPELNTITIPDGAKSISVYFKQNHRAAYWVDNLEFAVNWTTSVADVNGESKTLTVYPNPVQNEIAFSGVEDVETVDIVSLGGATISCPIVNGKVNVSKLAAGEYVIVVNKTISGKFIKK
ncbi:MAG: T9SS type A sorting domain-containing protein [Paludibacteraceae bacterium]|nr:T9SS type A sorting domain-containing protein [Paludibacteraceae bacterium]